MKTWYDAAGRETASESIGSKGMKIESTKIYNSKGQLDSIVTQQGSLTTWINYDYDTQGRLKVESIEGGKKTEYSYGNRTVSITSNLHTTTKTFDAWGGIKSVTDTLAGNVAYSYKSVGKPGRINANGAVTTMDYDPAGNQKLLRDPNAGPVNYTYDAAGRVKTQVDSIGNNLSVSYDAQGRMATSTLKGISTVYTYGTTGYDINRLTKIETGSNSTSYTYDKYGRIFTETRQIDGAGQVTFGFGYNANGQLETTTYPGGVQVIREYDAYGNPVKITSQGQTVWELIGAGGRVTTTRLGGKLTATTSLDAQGFLQNQATVKAGSPNIRDFGYSFNAATGNLNYRINGLTGLKESFEYDALDRLRLVKEGASEVQTMAIEYMDNGNILSKTGLGKYDYDVKRPHAVAYVDYNPALMPSTGQSITYNAFNKADCLKDTIGSMAYQLDITYGPDQQRWKSVLKKNGSDVKTIIFAGDYEKFIDNGVTRELYYIGAPDGLAAIYLKPQSGQAIMYYAHKDHLGSIVSLTDSAGVAVFKASYDAWGKQTVSLNTISFYRGYTGHEHLPEFGLINMNGRMYDPVMGRFLSPDNYVQAADFSQSYNRYSYCWNNPLKYSDPSGDFIFSLLAAAFFPPALPFTIYADAACWGAAFNVAANWDDIKKDGSFNKDKFWSYAGFGAANGLGAASGNIWIITATGALQSGGNEWTDNNFKYTDNILTEAGWGGITSYGFAYLTLPGNKKGLNLDGKISSYLQKSGWSQRTSNLLGSAAINFTYNLGTNSIYNKYLSKKEEDRTNWFSKAITDAALSTVFDMGFNYVENVSRNLVKQKADNLKYLDKEALKYYKGENRWDMPYEFKRYQPATPSINPIAPGGNYTLPILNIDKTR